MKNKYLSICNYNTLSIETQVIFYIFSHFPGIFFFKFKNVTVKLKLRCKRYYCILLFKENVCNLKNILIIYKFISEECRRKHVRNHVLLLKNSKSFVF